MSGAVVVFYTLCGVLASPSFLDDMGRRAHPLCWRPPVFNLSLQNSRLRPCIHSGSKQTFGSFDRFPSPYHMYPTFFFSLPQFAPRIVAGLRRVATHRGNALHARIHGPLPRVQAVPLRRARPPRFALRCVRWCATWPDPWMWFQRRHKSDLCHTETKAIGVRHVRMRWRWCDAQPRLLAEEVDRRGGSDSTSC